MVESKEKTDFTQMGDDEGVEITDEMLDAGMGAYWFGGWFDDRDRVAGILRAALAEKPRPSS